MRKSSLATASWFAAALPLAVLVGCGGTSEREPRPMRTTSIGTDCIDISLARDFRYLDDYNLIVYAPSRPGYHVELAQTCLGLRGQFRLALRSRTDRLCGFAGDAIVVDSGFPERCSVLSVRRLDAAAHDALIAQFETGREHQQGSFEVEQVEIPDDEETEEAADRDSSDEG